jgi:serine/threonine protein kinase
MMDEPVREDEAPKQQEEPVGSMVRKSSITGTIRRYGVSIPINNPATMDSGQKKSKPTLGVLLDDSGSDSEDDDDLPPMKIRRTKSDSVIYELSHKNNILQERFKKIDLSDFQMLHEIGKGAYGRVFLVQRITTKDFFAMKVVMLGEGVDDNFIQNLLNEKQICDSLIGEHVVKTYFTFSHKNYLIFIMEYMNGGDFARLVNECPLDQHQEGKFYAAELLLAIEYVHSKNIVHRDLKPENLLIDKTGHLKLADFGLSKFSRDSLKKNAISTENISHDIFKDFRTGSDDKTARIAEIVQSHREEKQLMHMKKQESVNRVVGTADYIPPEGYGSVPVDPKYQKCTDWWAFGCIFYEFLFTFPPFNAKTRDEVRQNILGHPETYKIEFPEIGDDEGCLSYAAKDLLDKLLEPDPSKRLGVNGAQEVKNHPYFKDIKWDTLRKQTPPIYDILQVLIKPPPPTDDSKRREIKLDDLFKIDPSKSQRKDGQKKAAGFEENYRTDLLFQDNEKEIANYNEKLDNLRNLKKKAVDKLRTIELEGNFLVFYS